MRLTATDEPDGRRLWVKAAEGAAEGCRLARESEILARARHPGVVQLAPAAGDRREGRLATVAVEGAPPGALSAGEVAGLGAAVATTVADLHDLGITHGACRLEHVIVDPAGRPVLCGFGSGTLPGERADPEAARRDDVASLAASLAERVGPDDRALRRVLDRAISQPVTARSLAAALARAVPGACLPSSSRNLAAGGGSAGGGSARQSRRGAGRRRGRAWALVGTVAAVSVGAAVLASGGGPHRGPVPGLGREGGTCASPGATCGGSGGVAVVGSRFATANGTWSVGETGDMVVVGRWSCRPPARPALLRSGTGEVWVFDHWPHPGEGVTGQRVATLPGARALVVVIGREGCDRLEVVTAAGERTPVYPPGSPGSAR